MVNKLTFEAVDRTLRDITGKIQKYFKIILC